MIRIVCCHAVRALRSTVPRPVPVTALMQRKRESINATGNSPFDPQKMADQISGIRKLRHGKRAVRVEYLETKVVHLQR